MEGFLLTNVMSKYERKPTIVTNIGGKQFQSHVTNYNIPFSFFDPCPIDNFLWYGCKSLINDFVVHFSLDLNPSKLHIAL